MAENEEGWAELAKLKREGKVRWIGVSNFSLEQLRRARALAPVTSLQPPYSLIRREIEAEILPYCERENIGVIAYSPMASGLLTGAMTRERAAGLPANDWRSRDVEFQRMAVIDLTRRTETLQADLRGSALRNQESRWRRGRECR